MKQITNKPFLLLVIAVVLFLLPMIYNSIELVAPATPYDITEDYITTTNSAGTYSGSMLIAIDETYNVYGLDTSDGSTEWTYSATTGNVMSATCTDDGVWVSINDTTDRMELLSYTDGSVLDTFNTTYYFTQMETVSNSILLGVEQISTDDVYEIDVVNETHTMVSDNTMTNLGTGLMISGEYFIYVENGSKGAFVNRLDGTTDGYTGYYDWDTIYGSLNGTQKSPYLDMVNNKVYVIEADGDFMKASLTGSNTVTADWFSATGLVPQRVFIMDDNDILISERGAIIRYPNEDLDTAIADYNISHTALNTMQDAVVYNGGVLYRGDMDGRVGAFDVSDGSTIWELDINDTSGDNIMYLSYSSGVISVSEFTTSFEFEGENGVVYMEHPTTGTAKYYQVCYTYTFDGTTNDLELTITDDLDTDNEVDYPTSSTTELYECTGGIEFGAWDMGIINVVFSDPTDTFEISNVAIVDRCVGAVCSPSTQELYEEYYTIETTNLTQYRSLFNVLPILTLSGLIITVLILAFKNGKQ